MTINHDRLARIGITDSLTYDGVQDVGCPFRLYNVIGLNRLRCPDEKLLLVPYFTKTSMQE